MFNIIKSIISAFFGIQNNRKFSQDDAFVEKHGIKYFLIIGFVVAILLLLTLAILVNVILNHIK
ncbi:DUF2970 domain-containing protein [Candidatus Methylopumilus rimovensis]|jgi:hypothetical protein|uniref:DUF2970 domain-containing protein n=1 Tax=Candidatus Methylopumilus rimovensis TaxID=2588535 RepID=A0AAE6FU36_9PROT|nr:DUF2970 domain-containing protein [Candidatus Methylopumilus rimovensis]QDD12568.1 DUF2970 domain-containing protein [Candidatus Methylopumilus rimovensis]QDD13871.1 DUF2970 domain-containing protein [Candidatus Methylopumilus rimovensis]